MKRFLDFATTTALGGLLVVVPGLLLALIADDMLLMVEGLVAPIADLLPADHIGGASMATVVALLLQSLQTYGVGAGELFAQGRKAHLQ
jgi:hypothetical protein